MLQCGSKAVKSVTIIYCRHLYKQNVLAYYTAHSTINKNRGKKLKRVLSILLLGSIIVLSGCESVIKNKAGRFDRSVNSANFDSYSIKMQPYSFQLIYISNYTRPLADTEPGWWKDAVVYQVYPRSFYDSDGDGHGDLPGLSSKLDYIKDLGFNAIWTLPVFYALNDGSVGRALGYEAIDYYGINPVYGSMADFDEYLAQAHKRDIKVILDMVMNHTSKTHPWFIASENKDPKYNDWYIWTSKKMEQLQQEGWKMPWGSGHTASVWHHSSIRTNELFYATWGGELNFKNPEVKKEAAKIARFWLDKGVDGYRLDAIRYLIEEGPHPLQADTVSSLNYMKEYHDVVKKANPQAMTVGEIWSGDNDVAKYYLDGRGLDQAFSFDFQGKVANSLKSERSTDLYYYIKNQKYAVGPNFFAPFLDNHDMSRIMGAFKNNFEKAKLGAAILLTFKGTPYVYFGSEVGTLGQYNPMVWDDSSTGGFTTGKPWIPLSPHKDPRNVAAQINDPGSLLNTYKRLIALRKKTPALTRGEIEVVKSANKSILSYMRTGTNGTVLVLVNLSGESQESELDFSKTGMNSSEQYDLLPMKY